jgi:hypothetical protein
MINKNTIKMRHEQPRPTSEASPAPEGQGEIDPSEAVREHVALLAYKFWESHGRPEGTDLEDWFRAERHFQRHA